MKNNEEIIDQLPEKKFNMFLAISKILLIGLAVGAILFTARAAFMDTVLDSLEKNYNSSTKSYHDAEKSARAALQVQRDISEKVCADYGALKNYKEAKKIPLKNDSNPCIEFHAPQEGF